MSFGGFGKSTRGIDRSTWISSSSLLSPAAHGMSMILAPVFIFFSRLKWRQLLGTVIEWSSTFKCELTERRPAPTHCHPHLRPIPLCQIWHWHHFPAPQKDHLRF
jgi:hypothetical protein